MGNLFSSASRAVLNAVNSLAAVDVTYRRGDAETRLPAVRGTTAATVTDESGFALRVKRADWLIDRCDLDLGDGPIEPAAGDVIVEADGTRWECESPAAGVQAWAWSDRDRTRFRLHVVELGADAES